MSGNLRPYSGGNPLVEADIQTDSGRFRITKQFYGRGSARVIDLANGRLVAQADEAENFIAGLVRGGTAGPAGLLWVRQGMTGIEKRNKSEEEGETKVRTSLLQSVQGEVEAVTGGRRMSEIMAAVDEQIENLVTKRGAKAGGRYALAIDERDRLQTEESKLGAEVGMLREALDKRAAATRRLAELDRAEDREERRKAIEAAQAAFDAAKSRADASGRRRCVRRSANCLCRVGCRADTGRGYTRAGGNARRARRADDRAVGGSRHPAGGAAGSRRAIAGRSHRSRFGRSDASPSPLRRGGG